MKLTWKEVVTKSNVNVPATATFYRDKFIDFFNYKYEGRNRRYDESCVEILNHIYKMYSEGKIYEHILESLEDKYGVQISNIVTQEDNTNPTTIQYDPSEDIKELLEEVSSLKNMVKKLTIEAENRDEILMKNIRMIQSQQQLNNRPWWAKIFKKKENEL